MATKSGEVGLRTIAVVEWPTLLVAGAIYGGFALLTGFAHALPWWLVLPLGAYFVAWHGSLQHEVTHGHPTASAALNEALVFPSLWLWLPFRLYREAHLRHHRDDDLTDPWADPESYYVTRDSWARLGRPMRALLWAHNSIAGRLLLGPAIAFWRLIAAEVAHFRGGGRAHLGAWVRHFLGVALVLAWVIGVCGIPLVDYLLLFAYPGVSLTLLRSFLEHRADAERARRTAIVEAGPLMALLYLNNNLHVVHHDEPRLPWYRIPARYREEREAILASNGGYRLRGYTEVVARYLLWPKEAPVFDAPSPSTTNP